MHIGLLVSVSLWAGCGFTGSQTSSGYTFQELHVFGGTTKRADGTPGPDGTGPASGVTIDSAGDLFGTALGGGLHDRGVVWEIKAKGGYVVLHDFGGDIDGPDHQTHPDGASPNGGVTLDAEGNIYGTTNGGGRYVHPGRDNGGVLWEITKAGVYRVLHYFGGPMTDAYGRAFTDGNGIWTGVTIDDLGNKFGASMYGGRNGAAGMVWELTADGEYRDLHDFGGQIISSYGTRSVDGIAEIGNVALDGSGNLYGATWRGGPNEELLGSGNIWVISKEGVYKDLHDFGGYVADIHGRRVLDGYECWSSITFDQDGNMYGTTCCGGLEGREHSRGKGVVWERYASGAYRVLADFSTTDQSYPKAGVTLDANGKIYGTASWNKPWVLARGGGLTFLPFEDGLVCLGAVTLDGEGNLYGTGAPAANGKTKGVVWKLKPNGSQR